jgi:hypothetical protein
MDVPKSFNYHAVNITTDYSMDANQYNVVYANIAADSTLVLPEINASIDGFPIRVHNYGPGMLSVTLHDFSMSYSMASDFALELVLNKAAGVWQVMLGPLLNTGGSSGGSITGPGSSTNNALVSWNGTGGDMLKNNTVLLAGNTFSTSSGDLTLAPVTRTINLGNNYRLLSGARTLITGLATTTIASVTLANNSSSMVVIRVALVNTTNGTDSASHDMTVRAKNLSGTISTVIFNSLISADTSLNTSAVTIGTSGSDLLVQASGVAGIAVAYQASLGVTTVTF